MNDETLIPMVVNESLGMTESADFLELLQADLIAGTLSYKDYRWHIQRENAIAAANLEDDLHA